MDRLIYTLTLFCFLSMSLMAQNHLYVGDSGLNQILKIDLDGTVLDTIDNDVNTPRGIEVDYENGYVFYANGTSERSIRSYNMETKEVVRLKSYLNEPNRISLDKDAQHIYYSEKQENKISRMNYDGSDTRVILDNWYRVNQFELDVENQIIFFVDYVGIMSRMNADGTNRERVSDDLDQVIKFRLDPVNEKIYMTEWGSLNSVTVMNYDGSGKETLLSFDARPTSLDISCGENKMYFTTIDDKVIRYADLDGTNQGVINYTGSSVLGNVTLEQTEVCLTSAVEELETESSFSIYPNPVQDELHILNENKIIKGVYVFSIDGKLILKRDLNKKDSHLLVKNLLPGSYLLKVAYDNGKVDFERFVKH